MKKIETVWHHLLYQALASGQFKHTQADLANIYSYSTSTVNLALAKPTAIGAIRKSGKFFVITDVSKLLYLWATIRNPKRDLIYHTHSPLTLDQLVGLTPPSALFGGYFAASQLLGEPPADYSNLHLYLPPHELELVKARYPSDHLGPNQIFVYQYPFDFYSKLNTTSTTLPHTFVDIWNMPDWYGRDFTSALEAKINDLLS